MFNAVLRGHDACLFSYGSCNADKQNTMFGTHETRQTLGIVPLALIYLFRLLNELKFKCDNRITMRLSAIELEGHDTDCIDLLTNQCFNYSPSHVLDHSKQCDNLERAFNCLDTALTNRASK